MPYCAQVRSGRCATRRQYGSRDVLASCIDAGGNIYYLAKLAGIFGL